MTGRRRIYVKDGFVCLDDGEVVMKLAVNLDIGFGRPAAALSDDELWLYYDRCRSE